MTDQELLIREAIAAQADEAVDHRVVLAGLRGARTRRRPTALIAAVSLTAVAAVVAVAVPTAVNRSAAPVTEPAAPPTSTTVLLMGLDEGQRPDAVVLARLGPDGAVGAVSLPRDTEVDIPGVGRGKLNHAYAHAYEAAVAAGQDGHEAGARSAVEAVRQLTGVPIDHHATVGMAAFGELADAVGGVEVCLRTPARDPFSGVDLPAGVHTLGGADALAFLRQRAGLPNGDLDRVLRHQAFLRSLLARVATVADDPAKLAALVAVARRTVRTDPGWDLAEAAGVLSPGGAVRGAVIPVGERVETGQGAVLAADPAAVREFTTGFLADPAPGSPPPSAAPPGEGNCVN